LVIPAKAGIQKSDQFVIDLAIYHKAIMLSRFSCHSRDKAIVCKANVITEECENPKRRSNRVRSDCLPQKQTKMTEQEKTEAVLTIRFWSKRRGVQAACFQVKEGLIAARKGKSRR
jgi:hypothetical protein